MSLWNINLTCGYQTYRNYIMPLKGKSEVEAKHKLNTLLIYSSEQSTKPFNLLMYIYSFKIRVQGTTCVSQMDSNRLIYTLVDTRPPIFGEMDEISIGRRDAGDSLSATTLISSPTSIQTRARYATVKRASIVFARLGWDKDRIPEIKRRTRRSKHGNACSALKFPSLKIIIFARPLEKLKLETRGQNLFFQMAPFSYVI